MRAYSYTLILLNFYACTAFVQRASFSSNVHTSTDLIKNHVNGKRKFTGLHMSWFEGLVAKNSKKNFKPPTFIKILDVIGSGSYGIVHEAKFDDDSDDDSETSLFIAKRAWTIDELRKKQIKTHGSSDTESTQVVDEKALKGRAERCKYYLDVEQHCGEKISSSHTNETKVPRLLGKYKDSTDQHEWLLFELITRSKDDTRTARSLKAVMDLDWIDQHRADEHHHLYILQKELRMDDSATFEDTLDVILRGLLISIAGVHDINIAHRDIKPDNLLIDGENQVRELTCY
jgi:serine/threonine protein kinase